MQPRPSPPAVHAEQDDSTWLAPVVSLARARQRRSFAHRRANAPSPDPDPLGAWLNQVLDATQQHGCVVRTTMTSLAVWRDLIDMVSSYPEVLEDTDTGRRIIITPDVAKFAAIDNACTLLTNLEARPRLDIELSFAPNLLQLAVRGVLADPVITPDVADDLTETLQATAPEHWTLDVTDTGALRWHTAARYRAVEP
jgi:hypothetical protein